MRLVISTIILILFYFAGCGKSDSDKSEMFKKKDTSAVKQKADSKKFAVSLHPTPVLNTYDFNSVYGGADSNTLRRSKNGLIKELEYVAFPGSVFEIIEEYKKNGYSIFKVKASDYNIPELNIELFIDSRFVEIKDTIPPARLIELPSETAIYNYFDKAMGSLYVWGANNINGVNEMLKFYKPKGVLNATEEKEWGIKGLDCSGLLYEATNGFTPRNTHQLVYYGEPVLIQGLNPEQIADKVKPLDLIVWKGHVIIVYDSSTTIQSSFREKRVLKKNLIDELEELCSKRKPVNEWTNDERKDFVIRRWVHLLTKK